MEIGIILQARMGSKRLPGKVLRDFCGKSLLSRIKERIDKISFNHKLIVATTNCREDDLIWSWCKFNNIECFRGNELEVLDRFYQCAINASFDQIIRLTADNPLIDNNEIENLLRSHINSSSDYSENKTTLPVGIGSEIFTFSALKKSWLYGKESHHREHVNEYIIENPDKFTINILDAPKSKISSVCSFTVDTFDDFYSVFNIFCSNGDSFLTTEKAIYLCTS